VTPKNTICLWFDKDALEAARFYSATFPDSKVSAVHKAPSDYPDGKEGDVLTVEFSVLGIPCLGLNGGPRFSHSEALSPPSRQRDGDSVARHSARRLFPTYGKFTLPVTRFACTVAPFFAGNTSTSSLSMSSTPHV